MDKNSSKSVLVGQGARCRDCAIHMGRYCHPTGWKPAPGRYWYRFWERCRRCGRIVHYDKARVAPDGSQGGERRDLRGVNSLPGFVTEPTIAWTGPRSRPDQPPWEPAEERAS